MARLRLGLAPHHVLPVAETDSASALARGWHGCVVRVRTPATLSEEDMTANAFAEPRGVGMFCPSVNCNSAIACPPDVTCVACACCCCCVET